jgi:hypothetical protein
VPDQVVAAASAIRANTKPGAGAEADSQGTVFFRLMHRMQLNQDQHSRVLSDHDARETAQGEQEQTSFHTQPLANSVCAAS